MHVTSAVKSSLSQVKLPLYFEKLYKRVTIFVFKIGPILISINPLSEVTPSPASYRLIQRFVDDLRYQAIEQFDTQSNLAASEGSESTTTTTSMPKHSIIISGESGSGKSEFCRIILSAFGARKTDSAVSTFSGSSQQSALLNKVLVANKVLESLGK